MPDQILKFLSFNLKLKGKLLELGNSMGVGFWFRDNRLKGTNSNKNCKTKLFY